MPSQADLEEIKKQSYNIQLGDDDLGFTEENTGLEINLNGVISTIGVDQLPAKIAVAEMEGWDIEILITLMRTDPEFVSNVVMKNYLAVKTGTNGDLYGLGGDNVKLSRLGRELKIVPTSYVSGDRLKSFIFWKAIILPENVKLIGAKGEYQKVQVKVIPIADLDKERGFMYGAWGNIDAEGIAPIGLMWMAGSRIPTPANNLVSIGMRVGAKDDLKVLAVYKTDGQAGALDDATDINSSDTSITLDGFSVAGVPTGSYLYAGTEAMYVTAGFSGTSGTATVIRGVLGTIAAAHLDDDVFTIITPRFYDETQQVSIASANSALVAVGNVANASDATRRGCIRAVAATASTNVTATKGSVTAVVSVAVT
jgi:hypothetical protein